MAGEKQYQDVTNATTSNADDITFGRVSFLSVEDQVPNRFRAIVDLGDCNVLRFMSATEPNFEVGDMVGVVACRADDVRRSAWVAVRGASRWRMCPVAKPSTSDDGDCLAQSTAATARNLNESHRHDRRDMLIIPEWAVSG